MLIITRRVQEEFIIFCGDIQIRVMPVEIDRNKVRLGIAAPPEVKILRKELIREKPNESKQ